MKSAQRLVCKIYSFCGAKLREREASDCSTADSGDRAVARINFRKQEGYSLLEILIALAIIGTLTAIVAPRLLGHVDRSNEVTTKTQAKQLQSALAMMQLDIGRFPTSDEGLELLVERPQDNAAWRGPYLSGDLPMDAWGFPFQYEPPALDDPMAMPRVYSLGADNAPGGSGNNADIDG